MVKKNDSSRAGPYESASTLVAWRITTLLLVFLLVILLFTGFIWPNDELEQQLASAQSEIETCKIFKSDVREAIGSPLENASDETLLSASRGLNDRNRKCSAELTNAKKEFQNVNARLNRLDALLTGALSQFNNEPPKNVCYSSVRITNACTSSLSVTWRSTASTQWTALDIGTKRSQLLRVPTSCFGGDAIVRLEAADAWKDAEASFHVLSTVHNRGTIPKYIFSCASAVPIFWRDYS